MRSCAISFQSLVSMPPHCNVQQTFERLGEAPVDPPRRESIYVSTTPPSDLCLQQKYPPRMSGLALYEETLTLPLHYGDEFVPPPKRQATPERYRPQDGEKPPNAASFSSGPPGVESVLSSNDWDSHSLVIARTACTSFSSPALCHQQSDEEIEEVLYTTIG